MAELIARMTGGSTPWCCSPPSLVSGGVRQRRYAVLIWTWRRAVRIRAAYVERSTGEMLLGSPKSTAGRRVVGIPAAIIPELALHLAIYVKDEPGALVFPGAKGGPIRRGNFNKMSAWP